MRKTLVIGLSVLLLSMNRTTEIPTLYVIGDSTASIYASSLYPRTGWAQILQQFFIADSVRIVDNALSGRSSKSFYDEGHWTPVKNALRQGAYVIIQFGHNDEKTTDAARGTLPGTTFKQYLTKYIDETVAKGAIPLLATPIERNSWNGNTLKSTHVTADGDYPQAIRDLAATKKVILIDATKLTNSFLQEIGKDSATKLFLNCAPGEWPNYPSGNTDNTHLQERGAKAVAQLIVNDIARQDILPLSKWIKGGATALVQSPELVHHAIYPGNQAAQKTTLPSVAQKTVMSPVWFDLKGRVVPSMRPSGTMAGNCVFLYYHKKDLHPGGTVKVSVR